MRPPRSPDGSPLRGRRIVITRAEPDARRLADRLAELGAQAIVVPAIRVEFADSAPLDAALQELARYHWVIFTSRHGVEAFFRRTDKLAGPKVAAVGPATAAELRKHGVEPHVVPAMHLGEAVLDALGE